MTTTEARQAANDPDIPDGRGSRVGRLRKWILGIAVIATFSAALGYLVGNEVQADTQFDQAHHALDVTRGRVGVTSRDLAAVRHDLAVVDGQIAVGSTALAGDASKLAGARAALANAQVAVSRQSSAIADLHVCLGGVERALNALSLGDQHQAVDALIVVSATCARAVADNG